MRSETTLAKIGRYLLPDGTELEAGPGYGEIDTINPPGKATKVMLFPGVFGSSDNLEF